LLLLLTFFLHVVVNVLLAVYRTSIFQN
jgi:hypothetical protein